MAAGRRFRLSKAFLIKSCKLDPPSTHSNSGFEENTTVMAGEAGDADSKPVEFTDPLADTAPMRIRRPEQEENEIDC